MPLTALNSGHSLIVRFLAGMVNSPLIGEGCDPSHGILARKPDTVSAY